MKTLIIIISVILLNIVLQAQITIDGTITDSESNPISDALVEIIDQDDTSNYYSSVTDVAGYFAISNITNIPSRKTSVPSEFIVLRNYPNPFNPSTKIYYSITSSSVIPNSVRDINTQIPDQVRNDKPIVTLKVYDIFGKEVVTLVNENQKPGFLKFFEMQATIQAEYISTN